MCPLKLLLIEDNEADRGVCKSSIDLYRDQRKRNIQLFEASTIAEARRLLAEIRDFDGAIIDIRLAAEADAGNRVGEEILKDFIRVPTVVLTGTPDAVNTSHNHVGIFKKGEITYVEIFDKIWDIYMIGLSRILGGRGLIEQGLFRIYKDTILKQLPSWIKYGGEDVEAAEKGLLRHTLSHLLHELEEDSDVYYSEEAYIFPPTDGNFRTGCIITIAAESNPHVVLNPACDLVLRKGGKPKTSRILVAEIERDENLKQTEGMLRSKSVSLIKKVKECSHHNDGSECYKHLSEIQNQNMKMALSKYYSNSHAAYLHWLPQTSFFCGGFINFRHIQTLKETDVAKSGSKIVAQLAPPFVKDLVSRFSSYYARQGQPDLRAPDSPAAAL
jgi:hypothetical protein